MAMRRGNRGRSRQGKRGRPVCTAADEDTRVKISVIIPTRSRARYLQSSLASAVCAAERAGCDVEIVVSDNASDDDTEAVVRGFDRAFIRYRRLPARVSMRENFETALDFSTGSHVVFIGDDDAVMPNGLRHLAVMIAGTDADILNWRFVNLHYFWPDPEAGRPGYLSLRPLTLTGRRRFLDPGALLRRFVTARFLNYKEGGMIYHGCVSRRLIERARKRSQGPYFWCSAPDVFASMQNLMVSDRPVLHVDIPVTLGGASPRSNGAGSQQYARGAKMAAGSEFSNFVAEYSEDRHLGSLPPRCPSIALLTLDALMTAGRLHGVDLAIDRTAWLGRIAGDLGPMPQDVREECFGYARALLGDDLDLPMPPAVSAPAAAPVAMPAGRPGRMRVRNKISKVRLLDGPELEDSFLAARLLDEVVGLDGYDFERWNRLREIGASCRLYADVAGRQLRALAG